MSRKSRLVGIAAILVMCALTSASFYVELAPRHSRANTSASPGWIEGVVTNGTDPLPNSYVLYIMSAGSGGPIGSAWTDATGHYNLSVAGGIQYMVIAFNGSYYTAGGNAAPAIGGTDWCNITMTSIAPLVPDVVLTGFVLDSSGNPVPGGTVAGYISDPANGGQGIPLYGNTTTADPITGRYTVNVIPGSIGGGVAALDFPGYGFVENRTTAPFESGNTYWINITLANSPSTDDALLFGHVTDEDTGAPLSNVAVSIDSSNQWNSGSGYSNLTFTDGAGDYVMNVTNGSARITFQTTGYCTYQVENVQIDPGANFRVDASLLATNATISGNVTDESTGLPLVGAYVFLTDNMGHYTSAITDSSGSYDLPAFIAPSLYVGAQMTGYSANFTLISIAPGDHLWQDFGLVPLNSWLSGTVTDLITGLPITDANIWLQSTSSPSSFSAKTNSTGEYNVSLVSDEYSVQVGAMNYDPYWGTLNVTPGGNVFDIVLMPSNPPLTTRMYGWVNDSISGLGLPNASIGVAFAPPYSGQTFFTTANDTGYYEIWIPPMPVEVVVTATDHVHADEMVNATGLTEVMVNVELAPDMWAPNVTYDQSTLENISWTNPAWINMSAQELDPKNFVLAEFGFVNSSEGTTDYSLVQMYYDNFDPMSQSSSNLPYSQVGDMYTMSIEWTATATGGWLDNGSARQYFATYLMPMGPTTYEGLRAQYYNETLGESYSGTAWFDNATGDFAFFSFDNGSLSQATPDDLTGMISPQVSMIRVNDTTGMISWMSSFSEGNWSVVGLTLTYDSLLPSGKYVSLFSVSDFGGRGNANVTFFTVDNELPVADAGPDQAVMPGDTVIFDGSNSTDNVGIVNYTWTFYDGATLVTLWGPNPNYTFLSEGVYDVTLTVTDGAGHTSTDTVTITVTAVIPEFPTIIIPLAGMMAIFAVVWTRRRRLEI
jgi:protocatechuate 3,4-dioxygenase beta subunit